MQWSIVGQREDHFTTHTYRVTTRERRSVSSCFLLTGDKLRTGSSMMDKLSHTKKRLTDEISCRPQTPAWDPQTGPIVLFLACCCNDELQVTIHQKCSFSSHHNLKHWMLYLLYEYWNDVSLHTHSTYTFPQWKFTLNSLMSPVYVRVNPVSHDMTQEALTCTEKNNSSL